MRAKKKILTAAISVALIASLITAAVGFESKQRADRSAAAGKTQNSVCQCPFGGKAGKFGKCPYIHPQTKTAVAIIAP